MIEIPRVSEEEGIANQAVAMLQAALSPALKVAAWLDDSEAAYRLLENSSPLALVLPVDMAVKTLDATGGRIARFTWSFQVIVSDRLLGTNPSASQGSNAKGPGLRAMKQVIALLFAGWTPRLCDNRDCDPAIITGFPYVPLSVGRDGEPTEVRQALAFSVTSPAVAGLGV